MFKEIQSRDLLPTEKKSNNFKRLNDCFSLHGTVCWIEVKVAVLCAHQYMPWNLLLIKVLHNSWYSKHQIPTRTCSEAYL